MSASSIPAIVNTAGTVLSIGATAKSMFDKGPNMPKIDMPDPAKPVDMPTMDDEAIKRARQQAVTRRQASSGRQSTILRDEETLG